MMSTARIYSDMIDDLVRDLTGRSDVRRASAVERCAGLPEDLLLEITSRLLVQYHKQVAWRWVVFLMGAIGVVSFAYILEGNMLFAYGVFGMVIARHLQLTYRHTGRSLQGLLQNSEDKRLIPILLLKYSSTDGSGVWPQHVRVRDLGLTQLLPYVVQSDDEWWTHQMRARLAALLRSRKIDNSMTHGVLHALSEIGDNDAIHDLLPLTRLNHHHAKWPRDTQPVDDPMGVRKAAVHCVDAIRARVNIRLQQSILLRACATDVPLSCSLPRPVEHDDYRAAIELMRPASLKNPQSTQE